MTQEERDRLKQLALTVGRQKAAGRNDDGTYGQPPEGYVLNPQTQQMVNVSSPNYPIQTSPGRAFVQGGFEGASMGASGEIAGAVGGEYARALADEQLKRNREAHPIAAYGGEFVGGASTGLGLGGALMKGGRAAVGALRAAPAAARAASPAAQAANAAAARSQSLARQIGSGAMIGGGEGALYGFNTGEGGAGNRATSAAIGAGVGMAGGAVAPVALRGAGAVANPIAGALGLKRAAPSVERGINRTIQDSGKSPEEIRALMRSAMEDGQDMYALADALGETGANRLSGLQRNAGPAKQEITDFLENRNFEAPDRIARTVGEAVGSDQTRKQAFDELAATRKRDAGVNYGGSFDNSRPVDPSGILKTIDEYVEGYAETGVELDDIGKAYQKVRNSLSGDAGGDGILRADLSDPRRVFQVRKQLVRMIQQAQARNDGGMVESLTVLRRRFDDALSDASDEYKVARDTYRQQSQTLDAFEAGGKEAMGPRRGQDIVDAFGKLEGDQADAFRLGYADTDLARVEQVGPRGNAARKYQTPRARAVYDALADDPEQFRRRMDRELTMGETTAKALYGSRSGDNLSAQAAAAADEAGVVITAASGRPGQAAAQAFAGLSRLAAGETPTVQQEIARAMMSTDPEQYLQRAVQRGVIDDRKRRAIEAALRQGNKPVAETGEAIAGMR